MREINSSEILQRRRDEDFMNREEKLRANRDDLQISDGPEEILMLPARFCLRLYVPSSPIFTNHTYIITPQKSGLIL